MLAVLAVYLPGQANATILVFRPELYFRTSGTVFLPTSSSFRLLLLQSYLWATKSGVNSLICFTRLVLAHHTYGMLLSSFRIHVWIIFTVYLKHFR